MEPDPSEELFDVLTAEGRPTGLVKPRALVHRDGDWHRSFHCWVVWPGDSGSARIVFQRRSLTKDTVPDLLDVSVGGHYRAGETLAQVVREVDEELGLSLGPGDLIPVGSRRSARVGGGRADREIQDVFVHVLSGGLDVLRPEPAEMTELYLLDSRDVTRLFGDEVERVPALRALVLPDRSLGTALPATVRRDDFVPVEDGYWAAAARTAERILAGERDVDLGLW
ncbi:MAG TPA: NUDIX domain-containing protein [Thermomicrobiaceae bacterium]|nr:NUDIX domain-containing protein [Thermomicrobiaceae bacterium]